MEKAFRSRTVCQKLFSQAKSADGRYGTDPKSNQELFDRLMKADPSGGANCHWLLKQYRDGMIDLNKVDQVREDIELFYEHNLALPDKKQNLDAYSYQEIAEIASKIRHGISLSTGVYDRKDVIVLINNNRFTVVIPLSFDAMKILGAGTKWCVSSERETAFEHFLMYSPLYFINFRGKKKEKYLFSFVAGEFRNAQDKLVPPELYYKITTAEPILRNFFMANEFRIRLRRIFEYIQNIQRKLSSDYDMNITQFLFTVFTVEPSFAEFSCRYDYEPDEPNESDENGSRNVKIMLDYIRKYYHGGFPFFEEFMNCYVFPYLLDEDEFYNSRPYIHEDEENDHIYDGIISNNREILYWGYRYHADEEYIGEKESRISVVIGDKPIFRSPKDFSKLEIADIWPASLTKEDIINIIINSYTLLELMIPDIVLAKSLDVELPDNILIQMIDYYSSFPSDKIKNFIDVFFSRFLSRKIIDNYLLFAYLSFYQKIQLSIPSEIESKIEEYFLKMNVRNIDTATNNSFIQFLQMRNSRWIPFESEIAKHLEYPYNFDSSFYIFVLIYSTYCFDIIGSKLANQLNSQNVASSIVYYLVSYLKKKILEGQEQPILISAILNILNGNIFINTNELYEIFDFLLQYQLTFKHHISKFMRVFMKIYLKKLESEKNSQEYLKHYFTLNAKVEDSDCLLETELNSEYNYSNFIYENRYNSISTKKDGRIDIIVAYCIYYLPYVPVTNLRVQNLKELIRSVERNNRALNINTGLPRFIEICGNAYFAQSFDLSRLSKEELYNSYEYQNQIPADMQVRFLNAVPEHVIPFYILIKPEFNCNNQASFQYLKESFPFYIYAKINLCKDVLAESEISEVIFTPLRAFLYLSHVVGNIPDQIQSCSSVEKYLCRSDAKLWQEYLRLVSQVLDKYSPACQTPQQLSIEIASTPSPYGNFADIVDNIEKRLQSDDNPVTIVKNLLSILLNLSSY